MLVRRASGAMNTNNFKNILLAAVSAGFLLTGCSTAQDQNSSFISDPFEEANRAVFSFNNAVDDILIHPIVKGYRYVVPEPGRRGVTNFLRNLKTPVTFTNEVLQGDVQGAEKAAFRGVVNTLVGGLGLFDVAGKEGWTYEQEDFGQTLGVWGVGHGPYLVVPFIGPSSTRDYAGYIVDSFADPLRWYLFNINEEEIYYSKMAVEYVDLRNSLMDVLLELERSSIDYYAAVRSTYYQRREALVRDEAATASDSGSIPDYSKGDPESN